VAVAVVAQVVVGEAVLALALVLVVRGGLTPGEEVVQASTIAAL